ncbi:MAG: class I SAM-dependent methyltransferase [Patescibacteria group bacterium]|nr:class I SAM-dependent methyltransferase [Patescibacteria group bacterium]
MIVVPESAFEKVMHDLGRYFEKISKIPAAKIVRDALDPVKPKEQLEILSRYFKNDSLEGKKLLEIGSGYGLFVAVARKEYMVEAYGVEPDGGEGFEGSHFVSQEIMKVNFLPQEAIIRAAGEKLPFADSSFDIVYSTNVLEHVSDPVQVINEAIRVCRPGGVIQIVVPNYGSIFDGHYACWYLPYQPKWLWKWYLKNILRRDPGFADTLRTNINYFYLKKVLSPFVASGKVQTLGYGEDVFKERMTHASFTPWAGLTKISKILQLAHRLKLVGLATWAMILIKAYNPIILTVKKLQ